MKIMQHQKIFDFFKRIKFADNNLFMALTSYQTYKIAFETLVFFIGRNNFTTFFC